jgi:thymidine kinase
MPLTVEQLRNGRYSFEVRRRKDAPFEPAHLVFEKLYGGGKAQLFINAVEIPGDPEGANQNVVEALQYAVERIVSGEGKIGALFGAMATAKSTFGVKLARWEPLTQVFKHFGDKRGAESRLWVQAKGGMSTDIPATIYDTFSDLLDPEIGIKFGEVPVAFFDEVNFVGKGDPPQADRRTFRKLVQRARETDTKLIFSGLDFDFRGVPWPNTEMVLEETDMFVIVLGGRCSFEGCGNPSLLTQRNVRIAEVSEGGVRPSHWGEQVVRVGSVLGADDYLPRCMDHHVVWSPEQAAEFDRQYE